MFSCSDPLSPSGLVLELLWMLCEQPDCAAECLHQTAVMEKLLAPVVALLSGQQVTHAFWRKPGRFLSEETFCGLGSSHSRNGVFINDALTDWIDYLFTEHAGFPGNHTDSYCGRSGSHCKHRQRISPLLIWEECGGAPGREVRLRSFDGKKQTFSGSLEDFCVELNMWNKSSRFMQSKQIRTGKAPMFLSKENFWEIKCIQNAYLVSIWNSLSLVLSSAVWP